MRCKVCVGVVRVCIYNNMSTKLELCSETCISADGAAAVETLRVELARAKEQARMSNVAAKKAADELKAGQAAQRQCEEKMSTMARELKKPLSGANSSRGITKPKRPISTRPCKRREKHDLSLERLGKRSGKLGR